MADRLDALGGMLEVDSAPGRGTTIRGRILLLAGHDGPMAGVIPGGSEGQPLGVDKPPAAERELDPGGSGPVDPHAELDPSAPGR
jgi:hypothetical protein